MIFANESLLFFHQRSYSPLSRFLDTVIGLDSHKSQNLTLELFCKFKLIHLTMGRITMFSADGCPHCVRTAAILTQYSIPFVEISVTKYPKKRKDMLALSNRLATPQVFFNTRHVGGADETIELLEQWNAEKSRSASPLERYKEEIEAMADPYNARFDIPDYLPVVVEASPPRGDAEYSMLLPNGKQATVLEVTETLKSILPLDTRMYNRTEYKNSCTGKQAVCAIMAHFKICVDQAVTFAKRLQDSRIIHHVTEEHAFENSEQYFYRLQYHHTPEVLNSYRVWTEQADPNSMRLIGRLTKQLNTIEASLTDTKGQVDYKRADSSSLYPAFEEAACELQSVDLAALDKDTLTVSTRPTYCRRKAPALLLTSTYSHASCFAGVWHQSLQSHDSVRFHESWDRLEKRRTPHILQLDCIECRRVHLQLPGLGEWNSAR
jgi:glutaredoxin